MLPKFADQKSPPSSPRAARGNSEAPRQYWGQGYAQEAVTALVAYAFVSFPLHRITASVDPQNAASVRVLEKCGFAKEAHFRQPEWFKGIWADDAIYAVLAADVAR